VVVGCGVDGVERMGQLIMSRPAGGPEASAGGGGDED